MRAFWLLLLGCVLVVSGDEMNVDEISFDDWDNTINEYNESFPNNDELALVAALTKDENWQDFHKTIARLNGTQDFETFLDSLKADHRSTYDQVWSFYEKKRISYRSLGDEERKLLDQLFSIVKPRLFDYYRLGKAQFLEVEEARKWKKAFGALSDQQKDLIRSKFPLLTYYVRSAGKVQNVEAEKTEADLSILIDEASRSGLVDRVLEETNNCSDYKKLLEALKAKDMEMYEKVKPLAERLYQSYQSLPEHPKVLLKQCFEWIFENRAAFIEENYDNYLTQEQLKEVRKRYYALPKEDQKLLESRFPLMIRNIKELIEVSIANSFGTN